MENTINQKKEAISYYNISYKSAYDGPGARVVIFFQACNANCVWCHSPHSQLDESPILFLKKQCIMCKTCQNVCQNNVHQFIENKHILNRDNCIKCGACILACPNSSKYKPINALSLPTVKTTVLELFQNILPHLKMLQNIGGITLSGGEALLQKTAVIKLLKLCKSYKINTAIETSGLLPVEKYKNLDELVDYWLYGLRFTTNYSHNDHTKQIKESIKIIKSYNKEILCRIPIIPGHTDTDWYLNKCANFFYENNITKVFLNPWNVNTSHYYKLSGIEEKMEMPSMKTIIKSEEKVKNFFLNKNISIKDISLY